LYTLSTAVFWRHKCQFIFLCPTKLLIIVIDHFRIKCLSSSKISAILCVLYFLFLNVFILSWKTCQLMWENLVFLVIFDTCDLVYNWFISLLPPIVFDNLFGLNKDGFLNRNNKRKKSILKLNILYISGADVNITFSIKLYKGQEMSIIFSSFYLNHFKIW